MGTPPSPPQNGGVVGRGIDLISGVTTWKRAFILLALGSALLFGTMLYQHPQWIEELTIHLVEKQAVLVPTSEIQAALPELRTLLHAQLVAVLGTYAARNEQWVMAYDVDPQSLPAIKEITETRWKSVMPMFTGGEQNELLLRIVEGEVACSTIAPEGGTGMPIVKALRLTMVCGAGIPLSPEALLGVVMAGFTTTPDRLEVGRIRAILRKYAEKWWK